MANIKCRYYTYYCARSGKGDINSCSNAYCFTGDEEYSPGFCDNYMTSKLRCDDSNNRRGETSPCVFLRSTYNEFEKNVKSYDLDMGRTLDGDYGSSYLFLRGTSILVDDMEYLEIDGRILIGADNEKEESE